MRHGLPTLALGAALLGASLGCGPRYARIEVYDQAGITVELRTERRGGKPVAKGHAHPATIASVRVAHILARIDVRLGEAEEGDPKSERRPAFPTVALYQIGAEVSRAFSQANPDQEVVVKAVRKEERFGIFHQKYLTSFVAWMQGDDLVIHLAHADWPLPKGEKEDEVPEPYVGREVQKFKVMPSEGLVPSGAQSLVVDWRSPVFREPTHVRVGPDGRLLRRTVLMEDTSPEAGKEEEPALLPSDLSPEVLRGLADLQEQRERGEISETTYHARRRDLLRQAADEK